jgi:hypothetical protein
MAGPRWLDWKELLMNRRFSSAVLLIGMITLGCGQASDEGAPSADSEAMISYPEIAQDVASDPDYRLAFTGKKSGIEYYVRKVENLATIPDELLDRQLTDPDGTGHLVYVPVKDGRIVDPNDEDVTALVVRLAFERQKQGIDQ